MTQEESKHTKEKILSAAYDLFGDKGIEGTSMREIALSADVALSAINYHFSTKNLLAKAVLQECILRFKSNVETVVKENWELSFEDLIIAVFRSIMTDANHFARTFKLIQSTEIDMDFDEKTQEDFETGPPGSKLLLAHLSEQLPHSLSEEDKKWMVQCLFMLVDYYALFSQTSIMKNPVIQKHCNNEKFEKNLRQLVRAMLVYLKINDR
jgi:AcrR family transcriptional regulator